MDEAVRKAFLEDGAVLIKGALSQEQLAKCRAAYDWAVENPGRFASRMYDGTGQQSHVDNSNPLAKPKLDELMTSMPFGKLFADLWGSEHVWYFAEEIKANPGAYEILSWATEPGDVLLLHPGTLHGGAPVDAGFPNRHTFVFRFFGDDATYSPLPDKSRSGYAVTGTLFREEMSSLKAGEPFRSPVFQQLV